MHVEVWRQRFPSLEQGRAAELRIRVRPYGRTLQRGSKAPCPRLGSGTAPKRRYRRSHGSSQVHHAGIAGVHVPRTAQDGGGFCNALSGTYQG